MSDYQGDIRIGDTIDIKFTSRAFATGAPTTLSGSPVISAYCDNGTVEITAGITLTVDLDSRTGLNNVRVVASGGNGFFSASNVGLVITAGTVGGTSVVGECVGSFSIECRSALMPTTATRKLDVSTGGEAGVDWANVGSPTTTQNLSGTTVKAVTDAVALPASATIAITGNITGNLSGSVGSVTSPVTVGTNNDKTGYRLSATAVDDILDEVVEGTTTLRQSVRLANAGIGGKASGLATTNAKYRDIGDSKNRIDATVDVDGNRSAVTLDLT